MDEKIKIIKRQTNYNEDEIKELMKKHNNDVEKIIMEYHGIDMNKKKDENFQIFQIIKKIFSTIRDFLNN